MISLHNINENSNVDNLMDEVHTAEKKIIMETSAWEITPTKQDKCDNNESSIIIHCQRVLINDSNSNGLDGSKSTDRPRRAVTEKVKSYAEIDAVVPTGRKQHPRDQPSSEPKKKRNAKIDEPGNLPEPEDDTHKIGQKKRPKVVQRSAFDHLSPLPEAQGLPAFPNTGKCEWSFEPKTRVLLAKFTTREMDSIDREFLLQMMERTDIALVSEGLYKDEHLKSWNLDYIKFRCGNYYSHRIRRFQLVERTLNSIHVRRFGEKIRETKENKYELRDKEFFTSLELNDDISMKIGDYIDYVKAWGYFNAIGTLSGETEFVSKEGKEFDLTKDRLYLIDFDVKKMLPESYESFRNTFMLPEILPGGNYCLMRSVTPEAQPFMGPNLYLTPPGSYTHFHQDGHGTVDSGHLCIAGYNEVVMLRRLDEGRKQHALHLLTCNDRRKDEIFYDALYGLPHDDGKKPEWPDEEAIANCKEMNYYPCVFILGPGQLLHIGKGRLHAFRKMTSKELEPTDCHHYLRHEIIRKNRINNDPLCLSIAWDWMYMGNSLEGMRNEIKCMMDCEALAFENGVRSLATPEVCLLEMAREELSRLASMIASERSSSISLRILESIRPYVFHLLNKQIDGIKKFTEKGAKIHEVPDAQQKHSTVDAFGNDYYCRLCQRELCNIYFHCEGCEQLLGKDFNICPECQGDPVKINVNVQLHPHRTVKSTVGHRADYNHLSRNTGSKKRCSCKNGPPCSICGFMICCSCQCHKVYSLRLRFYSIKDLKKLLKDVEIYCGTSNSLSHSSYLGIENELSDVDTGSVDQKSSTVAPNDISIYVDTNQRPKTPDDQVRNRSFVTHVCYSTPVKGGLEIQDDV